MPLYEYECSHCHHRYEKIESFSAPEKQKCPKCGKPAHRLLAAPAIQFKGSGWYVTDYARKGSSAAASTTTKSEKSGDGAGSGSSEKSAASTTASEKPAKKKD